MELVPELFIVGDNTNNGGRREGIGAGVVYCW